MRKIVKSKQMASVNEKEGTEFFISKLNLLHIYIIGLLMNAVYV